MADEKNVLIYISINFILAGVSSQRSEVTRPLQKPHRCIQDGIYEHPGDCKLYIRCFKQNATVFRCPNKLFFDELQLFCVWPSELPSDRITYCNGLASPSCFNKQDGKYQIMSDCGIFLVCKKGTPSVRSCKNQTLYDTRKKICTQASKLAVARRDFCKLNSVYRQGSCMRPCAANSQLLGVGSVACLETRGSFNSC